MIHPINSLKSHVSSVSGVPGLLTAADPLHDYMSSIKSLFNRGFRAFYHHLIKYVTACKSPVYAYFTRFYGYSSDPTNEKKMFEHSSTATDTQISDKCCDLPG